MHLIVGLGNPGAQYAAHRHNVGFVAIDEIADRHGFPPFRQKFSGLVTEGTIDGKKIILLKPQTFMNRSGDCVAQAARFYKLAPSDISVIHDELDLAPGKVRIKTGGGNGGHNGLRSIESHIGKDFVRVRIGIGHPGHKDRVQPHVLSNFHKAENVWLAPLLASLSDNISMLAKADASGLMNKLALAVPSTSKPMPAPQTSPTAQKPKAQSHIRQARKPDPQTKVPTSGPMADMLKKLFGKQS